MSDTNALASDGTWEVIGYLNDCEGCVALGFDGASNGIVVTAGKRPARYEWWPNRQSTTAWCANFVTQGYPEPWCNSMPTRLCVECCAQWRTEVEAGTRPAPFRISEICPTEVFVTATGEKRES